MVQYEFPGKMDLKALAMRGIGAKEIGRHMIFVNEFIYNKLEPTDDARMMTVLDMGGFALSNLSSDMLEVIKNSGEVSRRENMWLKDCIISFAFVSLLDLSGRLSLFRLCNHPGGDSICNACFPNL
jgi:hypothetical protein